jgi:hypothetical protein
MASNLVPFPRFKYIMNSSVPVTSRGSCTYRRLTVQELYT